MWRACSAHVAFYGVFWTELKLLSFKYAQKVNKQKILSKYSRFILVVPKRWTRYISLKRMNFLKKIKNKKNVFIGI